MIIDRLEYFIEHPEDENSLYAMFSIEERNILNTIRKFEQMTEHIDYLLKQYNIKWREDLFDS